MVSVCVLAMSCVLCVCCFFSTRRRHTRSLGDWSSDVCSSDLRPTHAVQRELRAAKWDHRLHHRRRSDDRSPPLELTPLAHRPASTKCPAITGHFSIGTRSPRLSSILVFPRVARMRLLLVFSIELVVEVYEIVVEVIVEVVLVVQLIVVQIFVIEVFVV